ncbi:MAG TPA: mitochondrial fission ELM1 family protein [Pseudoxanthomonas sp.]|nr:mitochondrial fission ELM1 family protein [Pseudoxanthomonas sp.]
MSVDSSQLWTLTDGHAGNRRQATALAEALGLGPAREWIVRPPAPWRWLAPRRLPGAACALGDALSDALGAAPGQPALAIGCGRQAALATRLLRERGSRSVQILDPRIDPAHWDAVIAPEHDGLDGPNVITLAGSLTPVDDAWLADARARFAAFAALPSPRTALLLGGDSAHARFDLEAFDLLAARLHSALERDGGSVLATTSRRTPRPVIDALRVRHARLPGLAWCGEDDRPNPYAGLLGWADRIVCTPDSVNMVSEACATRAPVYVFDPAGVSGRPARFIGSLLRRGRIRAMDAALAPFEVQPLRETARVAAQVRDRLGL